MDKRGYGAAKQAADELGAITGNLQEIYRGLAVFGDDDVERLNNDIRLLHKKLTEMGMGFANYAGAKFQEIPAYELGQAADHLEHYVDATKNYQTPGAKQQEQRLKIRLTHKVLNGLKQTLIAIQQSLMTQSLAMEWEKIKPYVQRTNNMLNYISRTIPAVESKQRKKRKSLTLESKLQNRLTVATITNTHNGQLSSIALRRLYGKKLATLIERNDQRAIKLAELISKRRSCQNSNTLNPIMLESIEQSVAQLSEELGVSAGIVNADVLGLINMANSKNGFSSKKQFSNNLTEGLMLNITKLASNALSIPHGQYLVWTTNAKHTMLVPTSEAAGDSNDIMASRPQRFDITTQELLGCWNKVERVIGESDDYDSKSSYDNPASGPERIGRPALKRKVEAAGGVRATAELTGLSPGDVSKHINNKEFEISGDSARSYMRGVGADPDDIYKYGQVKIADYDTDDKESARVDKEREEKQAEYNKSERRRNREANR